MVICPQKFYCSYKNEQHNKLVALTKTNQIEDGMIIELVLTASSKQEYGEDICLYMLHVHLYVTPNFFDYCGGILMGLVRQELKCDGCRQNFTNAVHTRCPIIVQDRMFPIIPPH